MYRGKPPVIIADKPNPLSKPLIDWSKENLPEEPATIDDEEEEQLKILKILKGYGVEI
jgi:hypothetical protein